MQERKASPTGDGNSHVFLLASPRGSCHFVEKETVLWTLETNGLLKIADHADGVVDFADLRGGDHKIRLTHHIGEAKKLVPSDTEDSIKAYFDEPYGKVGTDVFKKESLFHVAYEDGQIKHQFDLEIENDGKSKEIENDGKREIEKLMIIKRVDYYVHRSKQLWSVRFAMIEALFAASCHADGKIVRCECAVFHVVDDKSFIEFVIQRSISPLPIQGNLLNKLLEDSFELRKEKEKFVEMKDKFDKLKKNCRIHRQSLLKEDKDKGISFFKGVYDHLSATIEVVSNVSNIGATVKKLRKLNYHPNVCVFYGWEAHDDGYCFAYEKDGMSMAKYVVEEQNAYKEMSSHTLKILRGLISVVHHLHSKNLFHENLSPDNIFVSDNHTIKIGGLLDIKHTKENSCTCLLH